MDILTVFANQNEIKYFTFGTGSKSFVIIPGLSLQSVMLSADAVASAYSQFAKEYTVYVFDRAQNLSDGYTVENMADDVALAMKELGIRNAFVFGASQGGMIAQMIAIKYPELVGKMVLGSSASRLSDDSKELIHSWIKLASEERLVELNHSFFEKVYSKSLLDSLGDALHELEKQGSADDMIRFVKLAKACISFDCYNSLSSISCPTLVLGAYGDNVLGVQASVDIADALKCPIHLYSSSHAAYDEEPDYKDRIQAFFEQ